MREVAPGDLIFSFTDTRIFALGIAQSYCWKSPKPLEFGNSGQNWEDIGWRVKVRFTELANKVHPKDHIEILRPFLPDKYSPLQRSGSGLQSVYLTDVPMVLAANGNAIATAADIGPTRKQIHEARAARDAAKRDPGVVRRVWLDDELLGGTCRERAD